MSPPTVNSSSAFLASAARIARSLVSTSSRERAIHSPPSLARGTIIKRFPDSASATAWLRTASHSWLVRGRNSSVPSLVIIVRTESQISSALGSMTDCIRSFVSATGLKGGGWGPPHAAAETAHTRIDNNTQDFITRLETYHKAPADAVQSRRSTDAHAALLALVLLVLRDRGVRVAERRVRR